MNAGGKKIPVIEIFGPVIQGEGITAGVQTHFLRTGGCDYKCAWCDTLYAVTPALVKENATSMGQAEILEVLHAKGRDSGVKMLTISGGNPAMWDLTKLCVELLGLGWKIVVETQGSLWQPWFIHCSVVTVSPKPPSSKMVTDFTRLDVIIHKLKEARKETCLKIVVFDDADYDYAKEVFKRYGRIPTWKYMQPGTDQGLQNDGPHVAKIAESILNKTAWIMEKVLNDPEMSDVRVMPQLHSLVFGYARGV